MLKLLSVQCIANFISWNKNFHPEHSVKEIAIHLTQEDLNTLMFLKRKKQHFGHLDHKALFIYVWLMKLHASTFL